MLTRCNNWPAKLDLFIEEKRAQPFDWRTNNCAFFAADWLAILVGVDLAESFRGQVTTPRSALDIIHQRGETDAIAAGRLEEIGGLEVPVVQARRGDIVTTDTRHGPAMGVFLGNAGAFAGPEGVEFVKTADLRRAWRVA